MALESDPRATLSSDDPGQVLVVDLKARALAAGDDSLFGRVLGELVSDDRWSICEGCVVRQECPMRFNALSFADPQRGPTTSRRLAELARGVHMRRELRPTFRDLRSAFGFAITHDVSCAEVHAERHQGPLRMRFPNVCTSTPCSTGPVVPISCLTRGQNSIQRSSRRLNWIATSTFTVTPIKRVVCAGFRRARCASAPPTAANTQRQIRVDGGNEAQVLLRGPRGSAGPTSAASRNPALPLSQMRFHRAVIEQDSAHDLLPSLLDGLARADGVPEDAVGGRSALRRNAATDAEVVVIKRFPASDFVIRRPASDLGFVESLPDHFAIATSRRRSPADRDAGSIRASDAGTRGLPSGRRGAESLRRRSQRLSRTSSSRIPPKKCFW